MTEFTQVQATQAVRLMSPNGMHCTLMEAGERRAIHPDLVPVALQNGCLPVTANGEPAAPEPVPAVPETGVDQVLDAIKLIFQLGDARQLTLTGDPKIKAIEDLVGRTVGRDERDQALQLYREEAE